MEQPKKRKGLKIALWIVATPIMLFFSLMVLLYVPFIQQFIRQQAAQIASESTGMDIRVGRIDLRFPLNLRVSQVEVLRQDTLFADSLAVDSLTTPRSATDTLLLLDLLEVKVQALPLFKGKVEIDKVSVQGVELHSGNLIEGMEIDGTLGEFFLKSHGVDLPAEELVLNEVALRDTRMTVALTDTTSAQPEDTTSTSIGWRILLHQLKLEQLELQLRLPNDSMLLGTHIGTFQVEETLADLRRNSYSMKRFLIDRSTVSYDLGTPPATPAAGLNPSHIAIRDLRTEVDSARFCGRDLQGNIRNFSFVEQSGFTVSSLTGRIYSDSTRIYLPDLKLTTP
ncbi:MAG: translocation/assembly module TamB, partial [Bacteroides sp.]